MNEFDDQCHGDGEGAGGLVALLPMILAAGGAAYSVIQANAARKGISVSEEIVNTAKSVGLDLDEIGNHLGLNLPQSDSGLEEPYRKLDKPVSGSGKPYRYNPNRR